MHDLECYLIEYSGQRSYTGASKVASLVTELRERHNALRRHMRMETAGEISSYHTFASIPIDFWC